ncbi:MAG: phosphotriesterase [Clostridia bacterium]|nr:phosphotriesterase [Clostridia bacterium]
METILGPISTKQLGRTLVHEHIFVGSANLYRAFGNRWYDKHRLIELAVREISHVRDTYGITAIIDATTPDIGRDLELIRTVSAETGVHIPYCTGLYYGEHPTLSGKKPEELAKYFIAECLEGSAMSDGSIGSAKPAFLKCATGSQGVTKLNRLTLAAMAITQRETNLPLYCHNTHSKQTATEQISVFREYGTDLSRVIIGHTSDTDDLAYLTELLTAGCQLSFDRIGTVPARIPAQAKTIATLIKTGWLDRITISHDYCVYIDFGRSNFAERYALGPCGQNRTMCVIHEQLLPALRACGISDTEIDTIMIENPTRLYGGRDI